jgi:alcohol dehydrogenase (cytochrome c)
LYSGTYEGKRHSALSQIDKESVRGLQLRWVFDFDTPHPVETTPLVVRGTMYATRPPNDVLAIDGLTGKLLWEFSWSLPEDMPRLCCGWVNRGLATLDDTVYLGTLDAHLVAIDARTGKKKWDVDVADHALGFNVTAAPLAVKETIVIGTSLGAVEGDGAALLAAAGLRERAAESPERGNDGRRAGEVLRSHLPEPRGPVQAGRRPERAHRRLRREDR